jgi:hypothetical protein
MAADFTTARRDVVVNKTLGFIMGSGYAYGLRDDRRLPASGTTRKSRLLGQVLVPAKQGQRGRAYFLAVPLASQRQAHMCPCKMPFAHIDICAPTLYSAAHTVNTKELLGP